MRVMLSKLAMNGLPNHRGKDVTITVEIKNKDQSILAVSRGTEEVGLYYGKSYDPGDLIVLTASGSGVFLVVSFDSTLPPTLIYLTGGQMIYPIPFGQLRDAHSPTSFTGGRHRILARIARPEEISGRRNLALNPHDMPMVTTGFPHATANVETRNEAVFFARNAIDGETLNTDHGKWPFSSWGINCDENAALTIHFGKMVKVDQAIIHLRADFPHDAWWSSAQLCFSNGFEWGVTFEKTGNGQSFAFPEQIVEWVRFERLVKADDPSLYPALTQIQLWGTHV